MGLRISLLLSVLSLVVLLSNMATEVGMAEVLVIVIVGGLSDSAGATIADDCDVSVLVAEGARRGLSSSSSSSLLPTSTTVSTTGVF